MRKIKIDFENITDKCEKAINTSEYNELIKKSKMQKKYIYLEMAVYIMFQVIWPLI